MVPRTAQIISVMSRVEVEGEVEQYCWLGSDSVIREMADDGSRNKEIGWSDDQNKDQGSSWLQLSIGATTSAQTDHHQSKHVEASVSGLVELDLLPAGGGQSVAAAGASDLLFQHPPPISFSRHPEINWPFSPFPVPSNPIMGIMPTPSSSRPMWSYFPRPFQFPAAADVAGPSTHIRVVDPPRRPHSGIWFMLQALPNQAKEPFLPQIPKSYLRIKDERMTVRLLMKYLARKLRLESDSEIEIRCRGQLLVPFLTLQHVRDTIWTPRDTLLSRSSPTTTADHIMVLHYGRSA